MSTGFDVRSNALISLRRINAPQAHIVVVKNRSGVQMFFFYNHLCRNSVIRNIIMESGIKCIFETAFYFFAFIFALSSNTRSSYFLVSGSSLRASLASSNALGKFPDL